MPFDKEVDLGPCDIVLDGKPAPPKAAKPLIFSPCLLWQTAGWIKMPLGSEVDLGPGYIVLDGDPAPPKRGTAARFFSAHVSCGQTVAHLGYC